MRRRFAFSRSIALLALLRGASFAHAQAALDLRPAAAAPDAGAGLGAIAASQTLMRDAERLSHEAGSASAARAALRRFTSDLFTTGEEMGTTGSTRVLLARTLVRGMDALDAAIASLPSDNEPARDLTLGLLAADLDHARDSLHDDKSDAWRLTRNALSILTRSFTARGTGWPQAPNGGEVPSIDAIRRRLDSIPGAPSDLRHATDSTLAILQDIDESAPQYPIARHLRRQLNAVGETLSRRPAWLSEPSASAASGAFLFTIPRLVNQDTRDQALTLVDRLAVWCKIVSLADSWGNDAAAAKARGALAEIVPTATSGATLEHLTRVRSILEVAIAPGTLADEKVLARPLRPAWHALAQSLRAGQGPLMIALPAAIRTESGMSDPAVLTPLATQREVLRDLRLIESFARQSLAPSDPSRAAQEPQIAASHARLADRVLRIGQEMARPDRAAEARESLHTLLQTLDRFTFFPGEASLQAATALGASDPERAAWDALTGGRTAALRAEIIARREAWLESLRKGAAPKPEELARLETLRALVDDLQLAIPALGGKEHSASPLAAALQQWGGWELSDDAREMLVIDLAKDASEATRLVLEGDKPASDTALRRLRERHSAALLMGFLARNLPTTDTKTPSTSSVITAATPGSSSSEGAAKQIASPAASILAEIGFGGPIAGESWMSDHVADIADVCRYAEELVALQNQRNTSSPAAPKSEDLARYVNASATTLLDALR